MTTPMKTHDKGTAKAAADTMFGDPAEVAVKRIPPLWPLSRFVAVNPFAGLSGMDFSEASSLLGKTTGTVIAMPPDFYRERWSSGIITREDLEKSIREVAANSVTAGDGMAGLLSALEGESWDLPAHHLSALPSAFLDAACGSSWGAFASGEISKWCAAHFDKGQALWSFPWKGMPLFVAWKAAAGLDCNPGVAGISGWRNLVRSLPDDPMLVIEETSLKLRIPEQEAADVFHGLLLSVGGWAGHLQFLAHEKSLQGEKGESLRGLLAIRLVYEAALFQAFPVEMAQAGNPPCASARAGSVGSGGTAHLIWQRAHECAMQRSLFGQLAAGERTPGVSGPLDETPGFQAVFCIDVRSEIYRRSLEKVAPKGQTIGFAGFFGFPIEAVPAGETTGTPQCPVLLKPAVRVFENASRETLGAIGLRKRVTSAWKSFKSSAVSSFVFVELAGLGFLPKMLGDLLHWPDTTTAPGCHGSVDVDAIPMDTRIGMAAGALRHMGLSKGGLARIVLLCGHGSSTENNPYGSSLDCGACGGHTGEANARTAAAILNNPDVRSGLAGMGIPIPAETWFLAGLHNTTTDEVTLFDKESAPSTHRDEIALLGGSLARAGQLARKERAPLLGLSPSDPALEGLVTDRSRDWSQVRPEWGLAGNYAFIAASRERTRGIDLGGRVFLNDYRYDADEGASTLELLLCAPVVVASWINLQYYASTVDNRRFGSGDKTIHNVAGMLGVMEGNGGDIRTGLPLQSVHDGKEWRHEPLRLHVCVEAPKEAIDRILEKHPSVADLVANRWIHLFAMSGNSEDSLAFEKSNGRGAWSMESGKSS